MILTYGSHKAASHKQLRRRWTYVKALWRALNSFFGSRIQFKTTLKGASMLMNSAMRDLWMPGLCFLLLVASIITGFVKLAQGPTLASPLIISILWAFVAAGEQPYLAADMRCHVVSAQWGAHSNENTVQGTLEKVAWFSSDEYDSCVKLAWGFYSWHTCFQSWDL